VNTEISTVIDLPRNAGRFQEVEINPDTKLASAYTMCADVVDSVMLNTSVPVGSEDSC
jgi:hypothetical protein